MDVSIKIDTDYPWSGKVKISIDPSSPSRFTLSLRIPGWCKEFSIRINDERTKPVLKKGYARIKRIWKKGDVVELDMNMAVELIEANPKVRSDCGKTAFRRGPLIYCLEEVDNGKDLADIILSGRPRISIGKDKKIPPPGVVIIKADAFRRSRKGWENFLYDSRQSKLEPVRIKAIPYALWGNRKPGEMMVWIRSTPVVKG
jgi:hypothetical protein